MKEPGGLHLAADDPGAVTASGAAAWAQRPGPAKVLAAARAKLELGRRGNKVTVQVLLTDDERRDVARLLGRTWGTTNPEKGLTLGTLRGALQAKADVDLEELLAYLDPTPLRDDKTERATHKQARAELREDLIAELTSIALPRPVVDLALSRRWIPLVDPAGRQITADLCALWSELRQPSGVGAGRDRRWLLSELAQHLYGDPHGLDRDTERGRVAARVLAAAQSVPEPAPETRPAIDETARTVQEPISAGIDMGHIGRALTAETWRATWQAHDIVCDRVSSTVLVLGLELSGDGAASALTHAAAIHGEPLWLTARTLDGNWRGSPTVVRVCENPTIVEAAADHLGAACPPLVCTYGRPSVAAWRLLHRLANDGAQLLVTADRDKAGQQFLTELLALPNALEWGPDLAGLYEEARLAGLLTDLNLAAKSIDT